MNRPNSIPATLALAGTVSLFACESGPSYNPMLLTPDALTETAPDVFQTRFETSKGDFVIEVHRDWTCASFA